MKKKAKKTSTKISPTAYATGYFWYRHGLSTKALITPQGKKLDRAFRLLIAVTKLLSGVSLDAMMLARHRGIDGQLAKAIEDGRIQQVVEIAAGLSPRGWRFMQTYGDKLTYIETDLPHMAAIKRSLLEKGGLLSKRHRVMDLDALTDVGPQSLAAIVSKLDRKKGTAIITEGLMNYLPPQAARDVWQRIGKNLGLFEEGLYLADVYLMNENRHPAMAAFGAVLQVFVRGRMHVHFDSDAHGIAEMHRAGFNEVQIFPANELTVNRDIRNTRGAERVRVLEAWR